MLTKTILGEAIGVQHGGIQDRTSSNTVQGITHGLIIGKFKRGRTDQPMRINKDTIKARLGYEPNNPFYQVVQDCVDRFPSVWVLRVSAIEAIDTGGGGDGSGGDGDGDGGGGDTLLNVKWKTQNGYIINPYGAGFTLTSSGFGECPFFNYELMSAGILIKSGRFNCCDPLPTFNLSNDLSPFTLRVSDGSIYESATTASVEEPEPLPYLEGASYSVHTDRDTVYFQGAVNHPDANVVLYIANEPYRKAMPGLPKVPNGQYDPSYRSYPAVNNGDGTWSCTISEIIDIGDNPHAQFIIFVELELDGQVVLGESGGGFDYYNEPSGSWLHVYSQIALSSFGSADTSGCHRYWLVDIGTGEIRADKGEFYSLEPVFSSVPKVNINAEVGWTHALNGVAIRYHNTTPDPVTYNLHQTRMDEEGGIRDEYGNISECSGTFIERADFGYINSYLTSMPTETFLGSNQFTPVEITRTVGGTITNATITIPPLMVSEL